MPYINLKTTKKVSNEKCEAIKTAFGKAIETFPGKTEAWLMVGIDDGARLWFKGDASSDGAIVDVELLGTTTNEYAEKIGVEEGFVQFLNTLRYPIQLYTQTRTVYP